MADAQNFPDKPTLSDMQYWKFRPSKYKTITTTGQVKATDGMLNKIFVSSGTPTILIHDNAAAAGTVLVNSFVSAVAGSYDFGDTYFANGCYVTLTNAGTVTILYK